MFKLTTYDSSSGVGSGAGAILATRPKPILRRMTCPERMGRQQAQDTNFTFFFELLGCHNLEHYQKHGYACILADGPDG